MSALRELQQRWEQYLLHQKPENLQSLVMQPLSGTIHERIAIYADAYITRLLEVLEKNYPYLKLWVGEDEFYQLGKAYLDCYPSRYVSVRDVGQHLPDFLQTYALYQHQPVYAEMAMLEWAISSAVDAADAAALEQNALESISPEQWGNVIFGLHPSLQILHFTTNVIPVYQALVNGQAVPEINRNETTVCRVWRKELQVYYLTMNGVETDFLTGLQQQQTFAEISEKLCALMLEDQVVSYAIHQLLRWLNDKLLVSITIKETT